MESMTQIIQTMVSCGDKKEPAKMPRAEWLIQEMAILSAAYFELTDGGKPQAWLMGREEYSLFCLYLKTKWGIAFSPKDVMVYEGVPVIIKASGGVEMGMSLQGASQTALISKTSKSYSTSSHIVS